MLCRAQHKDSVTMKITQPWNLETFASLMHSRRKYPSTRQGNCNIVNTEQRSDICQAKGLSCLINFNRGVPLYDCNNNCVKPFVNAFLPQLFKAFQLGSLIFIVWDSYYRRYLRLCFVDYNP